MHDCVSESNMARNRDLYLKHKSAPLTPEMIFEFELN